MAERPQPPHGPGTPDRQELPHVKVAGFIASGPTREMMPDQFHAGEQVPVVHFRFGEHPDPLDKTNTHWYTVKFYREKAERVAERFEQAQLRVGQEVEVEGRLREREWLGRDQQMHTTLEILADRLRPVPSTSAPQQS
jgi:single-stranded DNA-binding protein